MMAKTDKSHTTVLVWFLQTRTRTDNIRIYSIIVSHYFNTTTTVVSIIHNTTLVNCIANLGWYVSNHVITAQHNVPHTLMHSVRERQKTPVALLPIRCLVFWSETMKAYYCLCCDAIHIARRLLRRPRKQMCPI